MNMKHKKQIFVNCWKCHKKFDIVSAERCYEHLNRGGMFYDGLNYGGDLYEYRKEPKKWTTKCSHCGTCICHKVDKMKPIKCKVLNEKGIMCVMPSVKLELKKLRVN